MQKCYKNIVGDYIVSVSTGAGQTEIAEAEYGEIMTAIRTAPTPPDGYAYKLRADDLTWELMELPPVPDEPTTDDKAEAYDILMGVSE